MKMLEDLAEVVRLSEAASDDMLWVVDHDGDVVCNGEEVAWPVSNKLDAPYIAALSNFFRTHHATIADMAKRLDAAERDAARYRWMREHDWDYPIVTVRQTGDHSSLGVEELDAAIDAAMQESGE